MIKDEVAIVEDWLRHTLDLFGSGNVYVLDNESTDGTESILRHYRPHVWSESVKASVEGPSKGQLITSLMHEDECDVLVPIDGDEFIGLQNSWDRDAIIAEFERLDLRQGPLLGQARVIDHPGSNRSVSFQSLKAILSRDL